MARKNKDKGEIIASNSLLILLYALIMLSFIVLINPPFHLIFGQEETSQTGQQENHRHLAKSNQSNKQK